MEESFRQPRPERSRWDRRRLLLAAGVVAAAMACYVNSLPNRFVFDDRIVIERNRLVREPDLVEILTTPYHWGAGGAGTGLYRPLPIATFAADHAVGGMNPVGYHVVNVALHAAVTVLVLDLAFLLGLPAWAAFAGALIFAVHPIHTEAVANLAGRAEVLAALFGLAAVAVYIRAARGSPRRRFLPAAAAVFFLLALLSKENAVTLVGFTLFWEATRGSFSRRGGTAGSAGDVLRRHAWLGGALAVYLVLRFVALGGTLVGPRSVPFVDNPLVTAGLVPRLLTALALVGRYTGLLLLPLRLSPDYSYAAFPPAESLRNLAVAGGSVTLAAAAVVLVMSWRRRRRAALAVGFSAITYAIVSNLFLLIGTIMGERLVYLPSAGLCLLAGLLVGSVRRRWGRAVAAGLLLMVTVPMAGRTVARNLDWHDSLRLFTAAEKVVPRSVRVLDNLGVALLREGRVEEAERRFVKALRIYPGHVASRLNLAQVELTRGDTAGAEREILRVLKEAPDDPGAILRLGEVRMRQGRLEEAEKSFRKVLDLDPDRLDARERLASVRLSRGDAAGARSLFLEVLAARPDSLPAWNGLGLAYRSLGRSEEAVKAFRRAVAASPETPALRVNLAGALRDAGEGASAERELRRAVETDSRFAPAWYQLALVLDEEGRTTEAIRACRKASELRPKHGPTLLELGRLYLAQGNPVSALDSLDRALARMPGDEATHALRAKALMSLGRRGEAEREYRRVIQLNPRAVGARNNLAILYALGGKTDLARREWTEALRIAPGSKEIRDNLRKLDRESR